MSDKEDALQEIVAIAKNNGITLTEITKALTDLPAKQSSSILSKLFGYLGGIFVFSGICVFVHMYWEDFNSAARVILTLGTGFVLFIMALVTLSDERYSRAATPLFLMSSALQPTGIFVMLDESSTERRSGRNGAQCLPSPPSSSAAFSLPRCLTCGM